MLSISFSKFMQAFYSFSLIAAVKHFLVQINCKLLLHGESAKPIHSSFPHTNTQRRKRPSRSQFSFPTSSRALSCPLDNNRNQRENQLSDNRICQFYISNTLFINSITQYRCDRFGYLLLLSSPLTVRVIGFANRRQ